jgi:serpin B
VTARRSAVVLGLAMAITVSAACAGTDDERRANVDRVVPTTEQADRSAAGVGLLGARVLTELTSQNGNVAVSPSLLAAQLGTIRAGARTATATEIDGLFLRSSLDEPPSVDDLGATVALLDELSGPQRTETRSGRVLVDHDLALWLQRGTDLDEEYLVSTARAFGTGVRLVDFRSAPEPAREAVNRWATNASNGRVGQLLAPGQVSGSTRLLSTGLLGLTAPWRYPFDADATRQATFTTDDGREIRVEMMRLTAPTGVRVASGPDWEAVALPYLGDEITMLVVLPAAGAAERVQARLSTGLLSEVQRSLQPRPVTVRLPRVAFTSDLLLDNVLVRLGAPQLFDIDTADLTGLAPTERLALTDLVQQVYLGIGEEGTGSGAATVATPPAVLPAGSPSMTADRPFLVAIVDARTGIPILLARIADPSS